MQFTTLFQQIINGLSLGSVYALIAVGYSLVYSILSFSNFAHGGFLVVGGYICYGLLSGLDVYGYFTIPPFNIWLAGLNALIGAGFIAVLTERLAYKPIRERTSMTLYLLIASMGVSIVIENIFVIVVGGRFRALPQDIFQDVFAVLEKILGFFGLQSTREGSSHLFNLGGNVTVSMFDILSLIVAVLFLGGLQLFLRRTRWGLAIRAAACDLRTAGLMGVNVSLLIGIVFFVAGVLAAIGGIFLSFRYTLYPQLGGITTKAFVAAVIGGLGSLPGAVVGSLILGLAEMLSTGFISSQMRDLVVFSLLVIMLLVKPAGFFGKQISDKI
ncbi:MAG: branched-chain amino acid ABC transporter permease [Synergistaceae bacterium]|jgi:branched-chain amino acid transport system permease protein|nr:branched-chain amino acid ABC transporter permease [Synergistaceae bacterium]